MDDIRSLLDEVTAVAAAAMTKAAGTKIECAVALHRRKRAVTISGSDDEAIVLDGQEQRLGDGPCIEAIESGEPELMDGPRGAKWPAFRRELAGTSFKGVLGVALDLGNDASAALDFFAAEAGVFTEEISTEAQQFAEVAGRALRLGLRIAAAELRAEDLAAAMKHRTAIDMAQGIIMAQNRCSAEEAFDILRNASSARNEKLHNVAHAVVSGISRVAPITHFEP